MSQPREKCITFAIPCYSAPELLIETIESVFRQSQSNWLLNIYDDNPDAPLDRDRISSYLEDPRVSYHLNASNLGISDNWNQCLTRAGSEFVTILHSDDCLLPHYIDMMLRLTADRPDSAAWFCQAQIIDVDGNACFSFVDRAKSYLRNKLPGNDLTGEAGVTSLLKGNYIMCPTVCYRKSAIGRQQFSSRWKFVLDLDFFIRLLMSGASISGTDEIAYAYRRHGDSQTSVLSRNMTRFEEETSWYDSVSSALSETGWHAAASVARRKRIVKLHLLYLILTDVLHFRISLAKQRLMFLVRA